MIKAAWVDMDKTERTESEGCAFRMRLRADRALPRHDAAEDARNGSLRRLAAPFRLRRPSIVGNAVPTTFFREPRGASLIIAHPFAAGGTFPGSGISIAYLADLGKHVRFYFKSIVF